MAWHCCSPIELVAYRVSERDAKFPSSFCFDLSIPANFVFWTQFHVCEVPRKLGQARTVGVPRALVPILVPLLVLQGRPQMGLRACVQSRWEWMGRGSPVLTHFKGIYDPERPGGNSFTHPRMGTSL